MALSESIGLSPTGPAAGAERSWSQAFGVLIIGLAILGAATAAATFAATQFDAWADFETPRAYRAGALETLTTARLGLFFAAFQLTALLLTWAAVRLFSRDRTKLLPFAGPHVGVAIALKAVAGVLALAAVYAAAVFSIDQGALLGDVRPFAKIVQAGSWWTLLLTAAVGAPLAEEALFRGLMYGVLRDSPVGALGAGVATAFVWASVHAQYSVYGLGAIFLIGLYLAWMRERTGSLIVPMLCHGVYNASIVLALLFLPANAFHAG
jgi:uncharacterized protein